jgi:hypothetical protein
MTEAAYPPAGLIAGAAEKVRSGLTAGGSRIRTLGPPKDGLGFEIASVAIVAVPTPLTQPTLSQPGTESSNPWRVEPPCPSERTGIIHAPSARIFRRFGKDECVKPPSRYPLNRSGVNGDPGKSPVPRKGPQLHVAGSRRCLHFGKNTCKRQLVRSPTSAGLTQRAARHVCSREILSGTWPKRASFSVPPRPRSQRD